jgi:hypothetical protein
MKRKKMNGAKKNSPDRNDDPRPLQGKTDRGEVRVLKHNANIRKIIYNCQLFYIFHRILANFACDATILIYYSHENAQTYQGTFQQEEEKCRSHIPVTV